MSIKYWVDEEKQRIYAEVHGILSEDETIEFLKKAWLHPEWASYDEIFDLTHAEEIRITSSGSMINLAQRYSAVKPSENESRYAVIAPDDATFGLGRMYQAYHEAFCNDRSEIKVFRDKELALLWLDERFNRHASLTISQDLTTV